MSEALDALQIRFRDAATAGEGLTLSADEVSLLYSFEDPSDAEPDPPPGSMVERVMTAEHQLDNFNLVLSKVMPSNPIMIRSNGIASPIVWSLFVSWLKTWAKDGTWFFGERHATVKHNGVEHVIAFDSQPSLALDDSPRNSPPTLPHPTCNPR